MRLSATSRERASLNLMPRAALKNLRILVVEDEMLVCMMIETMLADFGCIVVGPAANLEQALRLASDAEIDVALLDLNLNGTKSTRVADALTARGVPFAFATGYGVDGLHDRYRSAPVVSKPFDEDELVKTLEALLAPPPDEAAKRTAIR